MQRAEALRAACTHVSRHDWLHGIAPCPKCGLPLDRDRDPNEDTEDGIAVTHLRCGTRFVLELAR